MNKQELIEAVAADSKAGIESKAAAERAVNAVIDAIKAGIKKDGAVQLIGFGHFSIRKRSKRKGKDFSGKAITIKASKTVGFRAGTSLKELATKARPKAKK